jgi:hypothetical protein
MMKLPVEKSKGPWKKGKGVSATEFVAATKRMQAHRRAAASSQEDKEKWLKKEQEFRAILR